MLPSSQVRIDEIRAFVSKQAIGQPFTDRTLHDVECLIAQYASQRGFEVSSLHWDEGSLHVEIRERHLTNVDLRFRMGPACPMCEMGTVLDPSDYVCKTCRKSL